MARWKLFSKTRSKEEQIKEPQETRKEEEIKEEDQVLAEYKETLHTSTHKTKKGKKQALSDQRIWRDVDSIEKNIDNLDVNEAEKPVEKLEERIDKIISKRKGAHPSRKPSNVIYVVSKPQPGQVKGDWAVRGHGKIYSQHKKKESAIEQARKIAQQKNATVLIQNIDGTFSSSFKPKQKK